MEKENRMEQPGGSTPAMEGADNGPGGERLPWSKPVLHRLDAGRNTYLGTGGATDGILPTHS